MLLVLKGILMLSSGDGVSGNPPTIARCVILQRLMPTLHGLQEHLALNCLQVLPRKEG